MLIDNVKKNLPIFVFIIFLVLGLSLYANSLGNQFFWDDNDSIVNNAYVKNFDVGKMFSQNIAAGAGVTTNYYRPIPLLSFAFDYQLWGLNSFGFNLTDILLHIVNAWLVFIFISLLLSLWKTDSRERLSESFFGGRVFWLAFLPALIFLVHPINTEVVNYISARTDSIFSLFLLLILIFYFNFLQPQEGQGKILNYSAAAGFFILALLSKENAIIIPFLIILLEAIPVSPLSFWSRIKDAAGRVWPFFAILGIYLVLHLTVFYFSKNGGVLPGCLGDYCAYGIFKRGLVFLLAVLDYFKLLFLPFGLHMERAVSDLGPVYSLKTAIAFLAVSLWAVAAAVFWKKERGIAFGFFWFFILLFPVSGILIKILYPSYEHYLYLPLIGFWLAFFCLARLFFAKLGNGRVLLFSRIFFYVMLIACLVFWGFLTVRRNRDWHDPITFYEKNLKYSPQSFIEHTNLGIAYDEAGRHEEAIAEYEKAISIKDVYPQVHHDLANSLAAVKKYDEAEKEYLRAIEMDRGFIFSYRNLYNLYVFLGEREKAENTFKRLNELK